MAGTHYPARYDDFMAWFATDEACADYLEWLRWPAGFECQECQSVSACRLADGRFECWDCKKRISVSAGTVFDRTRTPLTVWFSAAWSFAAQKDGVSALALQRNLGLSSYQTAWMMLQRLRSVAAGRRRELLTGSVEVDETLVGGKHPGDKGGRTRGEKALVAVAVERLAPAGWGRCRLAVIEDASHQSLRYFLQDNVELGSRVITDGWSAYPLACGRLYEHEAHVAPGAQAVEELPAVHQVAGLLKKWLNGTHQGSFGDEHLPEYLAEFEFRFNRRHSAAPGLLFYRLMCHAVSSAPLRYGKCIKAQRPDRPNKPPPPATRGKPSSLEKPNAGRPWRQAA